MTKKDIKEDTKDFLEYKVIIIMLYVCTVFLQKRKEQESVVLKSKKLSDDAKKKWMKVMSNDCMSSEESGDEGTVIVHPLTWRSNTVNEMFKKISEVCKGNKSSQAKRQMKARTLGSNSRRPKPTVDMDTTWAVND